MSKLVFIDTTEFIAANFTFAGARFATVSARMTAEEIYLGVPEVTKREVRASIRKAVADAADAIARARKGARVLRNSTSTAHTTLFSDFPEEEVRAELEGQFEEFLASSRVKPIGIEWARAEDVFDLYFNRKPPFGEGKKKSEFPDAFTLSMLSEWGDSESKTVLIASSDPDLMNGVASFENLEYAGTLEQLLARLSKEIDELTPAAHEALKAVQQDIEELVCTEFNHLGFVLDDQDGDVGNVRALEASFEASLLHVEETEPGNAEAAFDIAGTVTYEADLSYDDMSTAVYDSEDKNWLVLHTVEETVTREEAVQAEVVLTFTIEKPENVKISINWGVPRDVSVSSSEMEDWPYK